MCGCSRVCRAVEIDRNRFNLLKGNIKKAAGASPTHGRVRFFNDDFLNVLLTEKIEMRERRPVVFLDPPWGGVDYKKQVRRSGWGGRGWGNSVRVYCHSAAVTTVCVAFRLRSTNTDHACSPSEY